MNPAPTAKSLSPKAAGQGAGQGAQSVQLAVTGANFATGITAMFAPSSGITVLNAAPSPSDPSQLLVDIPVANDATAGPRTLILENPDGGNSTLANALTINAAPKLTSVAPASRGQGATKQAIAITGANFVKGATVSFRLPAGATDDQQITVTTKFVSATQLVATIAISASAEAGPRDVAVSNNDGGPPVISASTFKVNAAPVVTGQASARRGFSGTVTLTGTGFQPGATVKISGTGVTMGGAPVVSADGTTITLRVTIASSATPGSRSVTITNNDGGPPATFQDAFSVTAT